MTGSPRFLENPNARMPCSLTPAGSWCDAVLHQDVAFRNFDYVGSRDWNAFEAQSHGLHTPCVRFAGRVAPPPRNTRFRLSAHLAGRDLHTRRVLMRNFRDILTSSQSPRLGLAHRSCIQDDHKAARRKRRRRTPHATSRRLPRSQHSERLNATWYNQFLPAVGFIIPSCLPHDLIHLHSDAAVDICEPSI